MAAAVGGSSRGRSAIVGINITPMVDVMLVLLVILMVSTNFITQQAIKVDLPNAKTSDGSVPQLAAVTLGKNGELFFDGSPVTREDLPAKFALAASAPEVSLVVSADEAVPHGRVMGVIDLARQAGITKFAVNVEQGE